MPTVEIWIDLLSKMHAAIDAAERYRNARNRAVKESDEDAGLDLVDTEFELDAALKHYREHGASAEAL